MRIWPFRPHAAPPCHREPFRASVLLMTNHGFLHPYRKPLLQVVLLAFVVLASGATFSADLSPAQAREEACFLVKIGSDPPSAGFSKTAQVFHIAPDFTPQALCILRLSSTRHTQQSAVAALVPATPCRAPPAVFLA